MIGADEHAPDDAVLLLDGLFLHRAELRDRSDLSILLDTAPAVAAERMRRRDGRPPAARYVLGQRLYFAGSDPRSRATLLLTGGRRARAPGRRRGARSRRAEP